MKITVFTNYSMKFICLIALSAVLLTTNSCTKKDTAASAKFAGTWHVTSSCGGSTNLTFTAAGDNAVTTPGSVGAVGCQKAVTFTLGVSGNTMSGSTSNTDNCGNTITSTWTGAISGNTLTITVGITGPGVSGSCVLSGTK